MITRARGLSLIEILVVIAIISVVALIAVLGVGLAGPERTVQREAERLGALIELACERAQMSGRETGLHFARGHYVFSYFYDKKWRVETDGELRRRDLPKGLDLSLTRNDERLEVKNDAPENPQSVCYPSGELEPFTATLSLGGRALYEVSGDVDGRVRAKSLATS